MNELCGLMQIGVGVSDLEAAVKWYAEVLNFKAKPIDDTGPAALMTQYTGGDVYQRRAVMLFNPNGGGGLEVWQFLDRTPEESRVPLTFNQPGIHTVDLYTSGSLDSLNKHFSKYEIELKPWERPSLASVIAWFKDPFGNSFRLLNSSYSIRSPFRGLFGGVAGVYICCSDIEESDSFYSKSLGMKELGSDRNLRLLGCCNSTQGFAFMYGPGQIELAQCDHPSASHSYGNRFWGDPGLMHVCFEVADFDQLKNSVNEKGVELTVDSKDSFTMERSAGRFGYLEDPDGTLIELIQVHSIPLLPKLGLHHRIKPGKAVPKWIIKQMCKPVL